MPGASADAQASAVAAVSGTILSSIPDLHMATVALPDAAAADSLRNEPAVDRVERDRMRAAQATPGDPESAGQWSLATIGWDTVHGNVDLPGEPILAILDTGVAADHPDLQGRLLPGLSFVDGTAPDTDPNGHGTWMTGIAAAATDNGVGIAGVAWSSVKVLPIAVLDEHGLGQDSTIIQGLVAAVDHGASVVLMAFSNPGFSTALQAAIDYAWAHDVVLVAATGNDASSSATFPAGDRGVMGVAGTDRDDVHVPDSNDGPSTFLAAPGTDILSTDRGGGYAAVSGTSAAAAEVAGAAALLRASDPNASNGTIVGRLARSAAVAGTAEETGNGRLDLARALSDRGTAEVQPAGVQGAANGGPFVGPYVAASSSNLTTVAVTSLAPSTAPPGGLKVPMLSFRITPAVADTYDKVVVQFTGTAAADIGTVYVYQESGSVPGTFSAASDTLRGSITTQTGGAYTINPTNFAVGGGTQLQFYVVVDLAAAATVGDTVDFKVLADQITFTSGTWPPASQVTAGTWDPAGSTTLDLGIFTAHADVGAPTIAGSSSNASGTYTVAASGADIGAATDQFQYLYKSLTGDGRIIARVVTQGNTNALAKAGVMWRQATGNVTRMAFLPITPSNGTEFEYRAGTTGAATGSGWSGAAIHAPYWVRLTRSANNFTAEVSPDGVTWTQVGTTQTIAMPAAALVGLAVTSHTNAQLSTVTFDNVSVQQSPVAVADASSTLEDTALNVASPGVLANDSDPGALPLTAVLVANPTNGTVSLSSNGAYTYTPNANFNGTDTFTYLARDTYNDSQVVTVTITITAVNDAPSFTKGADQVALEDAAAQTVAGWATALSKGPADEAGQTLSFIVSNNNNALFLTQPAIGATGTLTWRPAANAYGSATVSVQIHDTGGTANGGVDTSAVQTFTISVTGVNDIPSFTKGANQAVLEDPGPQSVSGWATAISAGVNEASQAVDFVMSNNNNALFSAQPAISAAGTLTYTLAANANGAATVTVQIHDDGGTANGGVNVSAAQTFTITVTAVNDAPSFTAGANQSVNEEAPAQTVAGWATALSRGPADEAAQTLSFIVSNTNNALFLTQPAIGATGTLTYQPAANAYGSATVSVQIHDTGGVLNGGVDTSAVQTFTITVVGINDVPSFTKGANQAVLEDAGAQSVSGWATAISAGPNEGSQAVDFIVSNTNNALFSTQPAVSPTGILSYTPAANANGAATVTVQIHDDGGTANGGVDLSAAQTFTITVSAVNDAPVVGLPASQTVMVAHTLTLSVGSGNTVSITDVDVGAASLALTLIAVNGTFSLAQVTGLTFTLGDGTADASMAFTGNLANVNAALNGLVFTPLVSFVGAASLAVTANDLGSTGAGGAQIGAGTLAIAVTNTAPVAIADAYSMSRDNTLTVVAPGVLANDTDLEGQALTVTAPRPQGGPSHGSLTLNADGSFSYTPVAGYTGSDTFTYTVGDGLLTSAAGTVTISVRDFGLVPANGWPVAFSASRYLDYTFPAYVAAGSVVTGATFSHTYRSLDGAGTTCIYLEVYASGVLLASHGSAGAPLSCNSGSGYVTDAVSLPEIDTVAKANAVTVRVYMRNSAGARTQTSLAQLGVSSYLP